MALSLITKRILSKNILLVQGSNFKYQLVISSNNPITIAPIVTIAVRNASYWNKDWRPGPYPKTEDEKRAAAKKYGLLREDYEPYPDDGTGYGDYPKLPMISADARDPNENYSYDEFRRNFGEPIHVDADLIGEDRFNVNERELVPLPMMWAILITFIASLAGLFWIGEQFKVCFVKKMPKHMPGDGKVHYSFELE